MNLNEYKNQVDENVIEPMLSYMEGWDEDDAEYTIDHVNTCKELIYSFLDKLTGIISPSDTVIMEEVKNLVLALNDLNAQADYCLIETDAREAIYEVIQTSAIECGLQEYDDDITEEWREW